MTLYLLFPWYRSQQYNTNETRKKYKHKFCFTTVNQDAASPNKQMIYILFDLNLIFFSDLKFI